LKKIILLMIYLSVWATCKSYPHKIISNGIWFAYPDPASRVVDVLADYPLLIKETILISNQVQEYKRLVITQSNINRVNEAMIKELSGDGLKKAVLPFAIGTGFGILTAIVVGILITP